MTQAPHTFEMKAISTRKGGSFLAITQAVDNSKNRDIGDRRGVEAHFHQMTSFQREDGYLAPQGDGKQRLLHQGIKYIITTLSNFQF